MEFFFQKYKFLLVPVVLAIFLFGGLFLFYQRSHPKKVVLLMRPEVTLTIIPGWNLRQVADYLVLKGVATSTEAVYAITGKPAYYYDWNNDYPPIINKKYRLEMAHDQSYEGFLAPETYRVFADANLIDVIEKFYAHRDSEFTDDLYSQISDLKYVKPNKWFVQVEKVLTVASIVEKETKHDADRALVADILWRRWGKNWALQVDSSVHYAVDRSGDVFTTSKERQVDSFWNTYKYPGLPPGPICSPSIESIKATINPNPNDYWYFLSDMDGNMHYARTLEEHNQNKYKYLR